MPNARDYQGFHKVDEATAEREAARKADFKACPILSDFVATMLQDLQYSEMDNACEDEREEGDTGTIYTLADETYQRCKAYCEAFMADNAADIETALELEPGDAGFLYAKEYMSYERIGSTLYLLAVGHGVSFTDNGDAECLERLNYATRAHRLEFDFDHESGKVWMYG
jgi:hypothetical protein